MSDRVVSPDPPQEILNNLIACYNRGAYKDAIKIAEKLARKFPNSIMLMNILGVTNIALTRYANAENAFKKAIKLNPSIPEPHNNLGILFFKQGHLDDAIKAYQTAIKLMPSFTDAHNNLGNAFKYQGKFEQANQCYMKALNLNPGFVQTHFNIGSLYEGQGEWGKALKAYRRALEIAPDNVDALINLGNISEKLDRYDDAITFYKDAIIQKPEFAEAYSNLGTVYEKQDRLTDAITCYEQAIKLKPDYIFAHTNLGNLLADQGRVEDAITCLKKALDIVPNSSFVLIDLANLLSQQGKNSLASDMLAKAIKYNSKDANIQNSAGNIFTQHRNFIAAKACYERAIALKSNYALAINNLGIIALETNHLDNAVEYFKRAIEINPHYAEAYNNLGTTLTKLNLPEQAVVNYEQAIKIKPDFDTAFTQKIHQQAHMCDWVALLEFEKVKDKLGITGEAVPPFALMASEDNPGRQLLRSQNFAEKKWGLIKVDKHIKPDKQSEKIRIGYFSADFHNHATMFLMAGLFAHHDKDKFEIFAYSYGENTDDEMRNFLVSKVDSFHEISSVSDSDVLSLVRASKLDIAVDLKGYTTDTRSNLFVHKLAPIQINYLGYPGSMGSTFMHYLIADPVLIPASHQKYYAEKIIYLPNSYQPNDDDRHIANVSQSRIDLGLPENGFVFCCFNNNYKIMPREFAIWMRLLAKIDGSVLWLLQSNEMSEHNLRCAAEKHGIDRTRLIFASKLPHAEHLARLSKADLFLDTFNYNAHTTASDALWAGLPILTLIGDQFAARVGASLLTSVGLDELITNNEDDYENKALFLASNRNELVRIKKVLGKQNPHHPLFNSQTYTRNLEKAYLSVYERYCEGLEADHVHVK